MKKLFLAIAILALGAGAGYAQDNSATKPAQEKTKHMKKAATASTADKANVKHATASATPSKEAVAANKGKHHKKMKKAKSGK